MSPSLRKAAILISALDLSSADRLLDQMGEQQAARVRHAVMELDDVPPAEQEAILAEFFGRPTAPTKRASEPPVDFESHGGVELHLSSSSPPVSIPAGPRFHFLHDAPSGALAQRLRHEHPQLIALVVAHLPAEKSAQLLEQLPSALAEEVLSRLADLDDADSEIVAELEQELQRLFAATVRPRVASGKRQEHVHAILGHLSRSRLPTESSAAPVQLETRNRLSQPASLARDAVTVRPSSPRANPAIPFEQLLSLPAEDFFAVFEEADPRIVMLALAGAPRRLFERYVGQFEGDRALEFERHLEQLRPLRLRDVEAAQRELAILAGRRLQSAKNAAESSRRFAAAA